MALAAHVGRVEAQAIVRELAERADGAELREAAQGDERVRAILSADAIDRVFDPATYLGSTDHYIDRALAAFQALRTRDIAEGAPHA